MDLGGVGLNRQGAPIQPTRKESSCAGASLFRRSGREVHLLQEGLEAGVGAEGIRRLLGITWAVYAFPRAVGAAVGAAILEGAEKRTRYRIIEEELSDPGFFKPAIREGVVAAVVNPRHPFLFQVVSASCGDEWERRGRSRGGDSGASLGGSSG